MGEWEPASCIAKGNYDFTDINTDQIDVKQLIFSIWIQKTALYGGRVNSCSKKNHLTPIQERMKKQRL